MWSEHATEDHEIPPGHIWEKDVSTSYEKQRKKKEATMTTTMVAVAAVCCYAMCLLESKAITIPRAYGAHSQWEIFKFSWNNLIGWKANLFLPFANARYFTFSENIRSLCEAPRKPDVDENKYSSWEEKTEKRHSHALTRIQTHTHTPFSQPEHSSQLSALALFLSLALYIATFCSLARYRKLLLRARIKRSLSISLH